MFHSIKLKPEDIIAIIITGLLFYGLSKLIY